MKMCESLYREAVSMKIQSIELKNFRSFSEKKLNFTAECGNPRQFTVLIGDNSAGKTTVLEAVTKCFVPLRYKR